MKKKLFLMQLIAVCLLLNSCITRNWLWVPNIDRDEMVKDLLINQDGTKLVVIGKKYHYFVNDEQKEVERLLKWNGKEKLKTRIGLGAKGSEAEIEISFEAAIKDFSKQQIEFIKSVYKYDWGIYDNGTKISIPRIKLKGTRIPAENSKIDNQEFVSTDLIKSDYKTAIFEDRTPAQTTGKVLLTPFTVAADIVLLPFYFLGVLAMGIGSK